MRDLFPVWDVGPSDSPSAVQLGTKDKGTLLSLQDLAASRMFSGIFKSTVTCPCKDRRPSRPTTIHFFTRALGKQNFVWKAFLLLRTLPMCLCLLNLPFLHLLVLGHLCPWVHAGWEDTELFYHSARENHSVCTGKLTYFSRLRDTPGKVGPEDHPATMAATGPEETWAGRDPKALWGSSALP